MGSTLPDDVEHLFHLAQAGVWAEAVAGSGEYTMSSLGVTLDEEGFIHTSFDHQVPGTAERYYRDRDDIVLLVISPTLVPAEIRLDEASNGALYPHIYGPLPVSAVVEVRPVTLQGDGSLDIEAVLPSS